MTRSFHHILQEQVEGTLLRLAQPELAAIKIKALGLSNIVIGRKRSHISLAGCSRHANLILRFGENSNDRVTFIVRSEEHTSELQSLMRISYAVFCLKKKKTKTTRKSKSSYHVLIIETIIIPIYAITLSLMHA